MRFAGLRFAALGALVLTLAATAHAGTTYYWYGSDTTLGGAGTWDTGVSTNTSWGISTSGTSTAWVNGVDSDAYFRGTGTATVTISSTVTAGSLDIGVIRHTFSGGTLNVANGISTTYTSASTTSINSAIALQASQTWSVAAGTLAVQSIISGNYGLTKTGAGTLRLSAMNTYTGGTTLSQGTLMLKSDSSTTTTLGTGVLTLSGGTLANTILSTLPNNISVTEGATASIRGPSSGSTLYLNLNGSITNVTTNSGTLTLSPGASRIQLGGDNSDYSGTFVLDMTASGYVFFTNTNAGSAKARFIINCTSGNTLTRVYTNIGTAPAVIQMGELSGTDGAILASSGSNCTYEIGALNTDSTYAGVFLDIGGATKITKVGSGTLTLAPGSFMYPAQLYSGITRINGGAILLGNENALGNSGTISFGGGALMYSASNTLDYSAKFSTDANQAYSVNTNGQSVAFASALTSSGGSLTKSGDGTLTLTGNNTYSGPTTVNGGTLQIGNGSTVGAVAGNIALASSTTLVFNRSNASTYSGAISGYGDVSHVGAGTTTLSGISSYSGATTVSNGTLRVTGSIAASSGVSMSSSSASLVLAGGTVGSVRVSDFATLAGYGSAGSVNVEGWSKFGSATDRNTWGGRLTTGYLTLDSYAYLNFGNIGAYTGTAAIVVTQSGGLTWNGAVSISLYGDAPVGAGTANLIQYTGDVSGVSYVWGTNSLANSRSTYTLGTATVGSVHYVNVSYVVDYPYWTGLAGDGGIWSTSAGAGNKNWKLVVAGTKTDYIDGDAVLFDDRVGTSSATVTLGMAVSPNGVTFNNSSSVSYTITGTDSGCYIGGNGGLTKSGDGTVTLLTNNSYGGTTTINAGTLRVGNGGTTGSLGYNNVVDNGALVFNRSDAVEFTYAISGAGSVSQVGSGTLTLTGNNSYTGGTYVNCTLQIGNGGDSGSIADSSTVVNNGELVFNRSGEYACNGAISGTGSVSITGGGTLTLSADNTCTGTTTIATGNVLQVGTGGNSGALACAVVNNGALILNRTGEGTLSGAISGDGSLSKSGSGTVTLSGANSYTGGTNLGSGALCVAHAGALGNTGTIAFNGGTLIFSAADTTDYSARFSTAGNQAYSIDTNGQNVTLAGDLTSSGGTLTKLGAGTLTLSGTNTYTGGVNINSGVLLAASADALGSTGTIVFNGGTLKFSSGNTTDYSSRFNSGMAFQVFSIDTGGQSVTFSTALGGSGSSMDIFGGGTLTLTGNNYFGGGVGKITIYSGTLRVGAGTGGAVATDVITYDALVFNRSNAYSFGYSISGTGSVANEGAGATTLSGAVGGSVSVCQAGAGTLSLASGSNTYTGGTHLSRGVLAAATASPFGSGAITVSGGTLTTTTLCTLANNMTVADSAVATIKGPASGFSNYFTLNGSISGGAGGTLTLTPAASRICLGGNNSGFSGTFVFDLTAGYVFFTGADSGSAQAKFVVNSNSTNTASKVYTNVGSTSVTIQMGELSGTTGSILATSAGTVNYEIGALNTDSTYAGVFMDVGGPTLVTKVGSGTLTLSGASSHTGMTTVNAGVLAYGIDNAISGAVTVNGGALDLGAYSGTSAAVTLTSGVITGTGTLTSTAGFSVAGGQISAPLAGTMGLTKSTAGTVTLSGANVYTGTTAVNGGMLVIQGDAATAALFIGTSDIGAGKLVFDYTAGGSATGSSISDQVKSILTASYNSGTNSWASGAIHSTLANSHSTDSYALGWSNNTATSAVTVKVVLYGDATMDGTVNIYDLGQVLANYNKSGVWDTGDFNYDGTVNIYDLGTVLANYNKSISLSEVSVNPSDYAGLDGQGVAALQAAGVNVVPEPGTLALLIAGAVGLLAYGWRRRKQFGI
jgi:fibronectin-binding autotransporter adhesin